MLHFLYFLLLLALLVQMQGVMIVAISRVQPANFAGVRSFPYQLKESVCSLAAFLLRE